MKKPQLPPPFLSNLFLIFLFIFQASVLMAQKPSIPNAPAIAAPNNTPPTLTYAQQAEFFLGPLDKSQIPTGILYDAVFTASDLDLYSDTGTLPATNSLHFFQAYNEMYNATFQKQGLKTPNELENQIDNFHPDPVYHHPLGIMQYRFSQLRDDAVSANLIRVQDGQYYDVVGRPSSPYTTTTSFLVSPLFVENTKLYSGRHYFYVDSRFVLSNTGLSVNSIQSVSINYNGTVTTQSAGTPMQVDIQASDQEQTLTLTVTLTNGTSYVEPVIIPWFDPNYVPTSCDGGTKITVQGDWFDGGYGTGGYAAEGTAYILCRSKLLRTAASQANRLFRWI